MRGFHASKKKKITASKNWVYLCLIPKNTGNYGIKEEKFDTKEKATYKAKANAESKETKTDNKYATTQVHD